MGLDLELLGKRSKGVSPGTTRGFIRNLFHSGVEIKKLYDFCSGLDFFLLGEKFKSQISEGKEILFSLNSLLNVFDQPSAREFTAGIGWDTLKTAVENRFSPDELMLIEKLLIICCHWDHNMLTQKGLYFNGC